VPSPPQPRVSVIMTAYNHEAYVADAIASVLAQDYPDFEVCIIDDGSTDDTRQRIAESIEGATAPIQVIEQKNAGQASALNEGFKATKGDLVAIMDGDDLWAPSKLSRMTRFIADHPDGGVYQHQVDDGTGHPYRVILPSGDIMARWLEDGVLNTAVDPYRVQVNVPTSGLMFRREVLDAVLPIPETLIVCPDFYLFVLGLTHGPLYSEPTTLATWRTHAANATHEARFSFKAYWLPVVFPTVNDALARQGVPLRFTFKRSALLWLPFLHLRAALKRRLQRAQGKRID